METFQSSGVELQFRQQGEGEPVVCIHGGMIPDTFDTIADRIAESHRFIAHRRRGFDGTPPHTDCTLSMVAGDVLALMDHLEIERAHIVGHSYGGATALQFALDAPERVHSLSLFEATLLFMPAAEAFGATAAKIVEVFQSGDSEQALLDMLIAVGGPNPRERMEGVLAADWFERAVADMPTLILADFGSLGAFELSTEQAAGITQPTLTVLGAESEQLFVESIKWLNESLPNTEPLVVKGATHMLHMDQPESIATGLIDFLNRHPMG
ncbi:MAG: alpha/beta fold hydrolase [Planctomycetota bacterium]|jgi:pimeloyl-ACP methyl ester carboxylesterase